MRTKSTLKTFLYGILFTSIIAILGLFKTKILLNCLGDDYVGIYQLFYQIYLYLSLVDGGIGASVTYLLYKPVADKNYKKINDIITGADSYFKKIGIIVIILGLLISFEIMFFIKETSIATWYIKLCFILYILSSAISYFTSSHAILYEAEQKLYKSSNLNHALSICESIAAIVIAILGGDLLLILIVFLALSILKNVIFIIISKKEHKFLKKSNNPNTSFKKEANNLIVNKLNTLIFENAGTIIVSKFLGLTFVVIYAAYNQIISMITQMVQRLNSALLPSIGNLLVSEKEKAKATFEELNSMVHYFGSLLFVPLFFMLTPFIKLWYGKSYTVTIVTSLLFILILYINIIKIPLETYVKAAGEFKSVRNCAIIQSVVCVTLSLLLVNKFKIAGVLFSMCIAFTCSMFIWYPIIIYKKIINSNVLTYYFKSLKYILGSLISIGIVYLIYKYMTINGLLMWFICGVIIFVINFIIITGYYYLVKENKFYNRIIFIIKNIIFKSK